MTPPYLKTWLKSDAPVLSFSMQCVCMHKATRIQMYTCGESLGVLGGGVWGGVDGQGDQWMGQRD